MLAGLSALAWPGAGAQAAGPLAGARLVAVTGSLDLDRRRCPAGVQPAPGICDRTRLTTRYAGAGTPRMRRIGGEGGFAAGVRIAATGDGTCSAETATTLVETALGIQMLSSARAVPVATPSTDVLVRSGRGGVRWAWLEPVRPGIRCAFFDEPEPALALPSGSGGALPRDVISDVLPLSAVRRRRFAVNITGQRSWVATDGAGRDVHSTAGWTLELSYRRGR